MQRGIYAIALSDQAVEGGLIVRGEAQSAYSRSMPFTAAEPVSENRTQALLETFLTQVRWEQGWAVLVLPTEFVSLRRLRFQFNDARKIRQVLPLELEEELLDAVEYHAWDADILPSSNGTTEVMVYLVQKAVLDAAVATLEQHRLSLQRATFSAQGLLQSKPPPSGHHMSIYVGSEECYAVHTLDGRLHALHSVTPHPGQLLAQINELAPGDPPDQLRRLFRPDAHGDRDGPRRELQEALRGRLERTVEELNRFIRVQSAGEPRTVSLHGLFGALLEHQEGGGLLSLQFPVDAWPGPPRTHIGVMHELLGAPRGLAAGRGFNFYRRVGTWLASLREMRGALLTATVLLVVLAGFLGAGFVMRMSALQARLDSVDQQIVRVLRVPRPLTSITINAAIARVQEQVDKLRKERAAAAQLENYHYDALRLLRDVSELIRNQKGVSVDTFSFNQDRFTLSGVTPSYAEAERLKERIAAMPRFKGRTVRITNSNVGQVIRFRLTAEP